MLRARGRLLDETPRVIGWLAGDSARRNPLVDLHPIRWRAPCSETQRSPG